jgi:glutathione synthase/RimK-type ligase-like ATP-grasp enzyme
VVAPETGQTLRNLVKIVEATGKPCLNCTSDTIEKAANKANLYAFLKNQKLSSPQALTLNTKSSLEEIERTICGLTFPVVLKPLDGVSCECINILQEEGKLLRQ